MANGLFNLKQVMQAVQQSAWVSQKPPAVEYLVVAGGGGGGRYNGGGGGGAGGLLAGIDPVPNGQTLLVTVGGGGAGGTNSGTGQGVSGSNSVFGTISSVGGGGAGGSDVPSPPTGNYGLSGGSGGGSGTNGSGFVAGGQGTFGQGNAGGRGNSDATSWRHGGGGGGAGTVGLDVISGTSGGLGNGGSGIASAINGTVTAYAGGGGGGVYTGYSSVGGVGGGGAGGNSSGTSPTAGTANTGGGGGGGGGGTNGAAGGSGIVIVSYPDVYAAAASTTGSPTVSTSGSGSIAFTSTSNQYLLGTANSLFQFGTGDFTWETWAYQNISGAYGFYSLGDVNAAGGFGIFTGAATIYVRIDGSGNDLTYYAPNSVFGNWVHLAVVRQSGTMTLYYNGTAVASGSRTQNITQQTPYIGNLAGLNYYLNGNMSNFRVVKGTAVYTANFTPSTTPLQKVTNTSLLLNANSGSFLADSSGNGVTFTVPNGSPAWNASSPFTVTGYKNRVYTWTSSGSITF